jgi:hypothetical protein
LQARNRQFKPKPKFKHSPLRRQVVARHLPPRERWVTQCLETLTTRGVINLTQ